MKTHALSGRRVAIVSRCSRTLHTFRMPLIEALRAAGAHATAFASTGDGYEGLLAASGVDLRHIPVSYRGVNPLGDGWLLLKLYTQFRELRPHIVHSFTPKPAIYATVAAAMAGVPVRAVTITGLGHAFTTASSRLRHIVEELYRFALLRAHVVFFQNSDDRDLFVSRGLVREDVTSLVPGSGIDLTRYSTAPLPHTRGDPLTFLMIARLLREKGVLEFAEAARRIKGRYPTVRFLLVGGIDSRNPSSLTESEVRALRVGDGVEWHGHVHDVRPYIAQSDVAVLPSYREGLPRSLLEGAAMGRALLATDTAGCRELVRHGETGYVVPVGVADELARAMEQLILYPERISLFGSNARLLAARGFDQQIVVDRSFEAYTELLRRNAAH